MVPTRGVLGWPSVWSGHYAVCPVHAFLISEFVRLHLAYIPKRAFGYARTSIPKVALLAARCIVDGTAVRGVLRSQKSLGQNPAGKRILVVTNAAAARPVVLKMGTTVTDLTLASNFVTTLSWK
jgi:hypothetical protein